MDRYELKHSPEIPAGFARIRSGPIRPDDLLSVWPSGGWLRSDSPEWNCGPVADAADAVCVIRKAAFDARRDLGIADAAAVAMRAYKINREPAAAANADKVVTGSAKQLSLFEGI